MSKKNYAESEEKLQVDIDCKGCYIDQKDEWLVCYLISGQTYVGQAAETA